MTEKKHPSGTDRIAEAVQKLDLSDEDLIVNIQGDQPVFHQDVISHMIAPLKEDVDIPMGTVQQQRICPIFFPLSDSSFSGFRV